MYREIYPCPVAAVEDSREDVVPPSSPEVAGQAEGVLSRGLRALTLGIVSCVLLIAFEATAVNTAMPVAASELDGLSLYAFAFSGFFTTSLFAMVVSGQWCDRSGPLAPLFTGIATFAAGLVVSGSATQMWTFLGGRSIQGLGGGLVIVALYVVVGRGYPERLRPAVMAAFSAAWILPSILGPAVSGTVTEHLGWRWVFLAIPVLVLLPLAVMLPALRRLQDTDKREDKGEDKREDKGEDKREDKREDKGEGHARGHGGERAGRGQELGRGGNTSASASATARLERRVFGQRGLLALAVAVGAGLLQYAGQERTWAALVPAAVGLALLAPAVVRLLPRGTFLAARGLPAVVLLRGIAAGSFLAAESFVPLLLVSQRGMSVTLAGLSLTSGGLSWALGAWLQSRPRFEPYRHRMVGAGMLLIALSLAGTALVLLPSVPVALVAVCWTVGGFGMGLVISSAGVLLLRLSRPEEAGSNSASLQVSDALGNIVLIGGCGVLFAALGGGSVAVQGAAGAGGAAPGHPGAFAAVLLSMAAVALLGALVTTRLRPRP